MSRRLRTTALVAADAAAYALVAAAAATVGAVVVGVATGGGLVRAKVLLFLAGVVMMAYATARLWPTSPEAFEDATTGEYRTGEAVGAPERTRFQGFVRAVPPARWLRAPPPRRRLSPPAKLFVASVAVLLTSYLLEAVFGVA